MVKSKQCLVVSQQKTTKKKQKKSDYQFPKNKIQSQPKLFTSQTRYSRLNNVIQISKKVIHISTKLFTFQKSLLETCRTKDLFLR